MLATQTEFFEILRILKDLDGDVTVEEYQLIFVPVLKRADYIFKFFFVSFLAPWLCIAIQVAVSEPKNRLLPSTYLYPIDALHRPAIYIGGIIFQAISSCIQDILDMALDTYAAALIDVVDGHIEMLSGRFSLLGTITNGRIKGPSEHQATLIDVCKKYISILR